MGIKQVPLHDKHLSLNAKMVDFAGFYMPVRYSSDKDEHLTVRKGVGVFDVSHMGEFEVKGKGSLDLIQKITSNDASTLVDGQAQYSCFPNSTGGIVDDLIVYKKSDDNYMLVVNASNIEKDWKWVNKHNDFDAQTKNISDDICLFAVQGPKAIEVLQPLTNVKLQDIKNYHFAIGQMVGIDNIIISATGYTGAGGFELYVNKENALKLWQSVFQSGEKYNIKPIGLGARDTLRLEMGYCLYGNDIDDTTSPLEANLGWITKFSKSFVNSENLLKQKKEGVTKKLVGFVMCERGIPRKDYEIFDINDNHIGKVTSGTQSPSLDIGIGMGYVQKDFSKPDTEILIQIRDKKLKAKITKTPFLNE